MTEEAPWRDGWEPFDPLRPCYTCGAPPTHYFDRDDSEPAYARCHHGPITHDPRYENGRWSGKTTAKDYERAYRRALKELTDNETEGRKSKGLPKAELAEQDLPPAQRTHQLDRIARSVLAEIFVARLTGLKWNQAYLKRGYRRRDKKADVGKNIEVRSSRFHDGYCSIYDNDPGDRVVVFVTGTNPFVCRGWIRARNGKLRHLYRPSRGGWSGRWDVPQDLLLPMGALPAE